MPQRNRPYQNILCALDLERPADAPLLAGIRLASQLGAQLRVVAAIRPALLSPKGFFSSELIAREALIDEARAAAKSRIRRYSDASVPVDVVVGDPGEVIASVAKHRANDLIVIGARARSGSEHILGTTATEVLRHADGIDVYACRGEHSTSATAIIAIDGSDITPEVLRISGRLLGTDTSMSVDVRVVCVVPPETGAGGDRRLEHCRHCLEHSPWADVEARVERRSVTHSLDAAIREYSADLLIIGSGENRGIGWAIGSTTNEVLHEVSCDVLVIRP